MSNSILYDPLLVHFLARELDASLRGRACAATPLFASDRSVVLVLDRGEALQLDLHPTAGWVRIVPWEEAADEPDSVCLGVDAPPDERLLEIRLRSGDRFRSLDRRLVVELHTNQWNAVLVADEDQRVVSALRSRAAGERTIRPGQPYQPPPPLARIGAAPVGMEEAWEQWQRALAAEEPSAKRSALLAGFAYTGAPNASWILGTPSGADPEGDLWRAFERWWWLHQLPPPEPVLLQVSRRRIPYPLPLTGERGERIDSLLAGMERLAATTAPDAEAEAVTPEQERWIRGRLAAAERRVRRLEEQASSVGEADRLRGWGDLILARLSAVPRGADAVRLADWEGGEVEIPLDPAVSPAENATRLYDRARRRERAEAQLPALLHRAREELDRWSNAARKVADGEVPEWLAAELARKSGSRDEDAGSDEPSESRPYRSYRTAGNLEVRVGRSARDNDRLTFGHSRPEDVWLHARSVAGSHVILRWNDTDNAPPARDLEEAATLAALFSKARSSALVPVDWTRRKYVRKPRGAAPGAVIPQRVKTLFVEPDPGTEERMRR